MIRYNHKFTISGKEYTTREISFKDYKELCKQASGASLSDLSELFDNLIFNTTLDAKADVGLYNAFQKFICLLHIRKLLHGNNIQLSIGGNLVNLDVDTIISLCPTSVIPIVVDVCGTKYYFGSPGQLFHSQDIDLIRSCIDTVQPRKGIIIQDTPWYLREAPLRDVQRIIDSSNLPLTSTTYKIKDNIECFPLKIFDQISITFNTVQPLQFLNTLFFFESLQTVYDIEYSAIKSLGLHAADFESFTYPEIKMLVNRVIKENKEKATQVE